MRSLTLRLVTLLSTAIVIVGVLFVVDLTLDLTTVASSVDPRFGQAVLWGLCGIYGLLIITSLVVLLQLPRALIPPADDSGPEFDRYLASLRSRLRENQRLGDRDLQSREAIDEAIEELNKHADELIRKTAVSVFLGTALLQNGRLDALVVLGTQTRLVWQVSRVYFQRPSPRQLLYLYRNIALSAFIAAGLEDIDWAEQVKPLLLSAMPSLQGIVPGMGGATNLLINSLASGTANALLTLRVGAIASTYCTSMTRPDRSLIRRSATVYAATRVIGVVMAPAQQVVAAFFKAAKSAAASSVGALADQIRRAGAGIQSVFSRTGKGEAEGGDEEHVEGASDPAAV